MRRIMPVILLAAISCAQAEPVAIPSDRIPFPLSRSAPPTQADQRFVRFRVAFVRNGRIAYVSHATFTRVGRVETVVRGLLTGPTVDQRRDGFRTEIPQTTGLLGISVIEDIVTVDLTQEFQRPGSSTSFLLRVAQVVYTLASLDEIVAVRFSIDGRAVRVPTDRGRTEEAPVRITDYERFRPRR